MKRPKFSLAALFVAALLPVVAISCDRGAGGAEQSGKAAPSKSVPTASSSAALAQVLGADALSDAAEKSIDSVVNISTTQMVRTSRNPFFDNPFFRDFFGGGMGDEHPREVPRQGLGSGVIIDAAGIILTNNHVVERAEKLTVTLHDNRSFDAEVVGTDPASDLAVIKLKKKADNLKALPFGDSDVLRLGEIVLAIGNPFGLSHTVTMGIVSAKGRADVGIAAYEDFIQTDAAINPGNSGGALINLRGELVGINTAIASQTGGYQGVGFAIPSNMARTIKEALESKGKIVRGWIGVSIKDVTPELADAMDIQAGRGVLVEDVVKDSPGKKAGLKAGDVILEVDGEKVNSASRLRNKIAMIGSGKTTGLKVLRDGKEMNLSIKLDERPNQLSQNDMESSGSEETVDGLAVTPLNPITRQEYDISDEVTKGVIVTGVERGSPAAQAGLRPGDVILEVNRKPADSVDTFVREYKKSKDKALLYVNRDGNQSFRVVKK
jgi:serine protease Do